MLANDNHSAAAASDSLAISRSGILTDSSTRIASAALAVAIVTSNSHPGT